MRELTFTARFSKASLKLLLAYATGQHVRSSVLSARRPAAAPSDFLVISLSDVLVVAYDVSSRELGSGVLDRVSLHFAKIQFEYRPQAADGTAGSPVKVGWDGAAEPRDLSGAPPANSARFAGAGLVRGHHPVFGGGGPSAPAPPALDPRRRRHRAPKAPRRVLP
jgi:hypothetical protein